MAHSSCPFCSEPSRAFLRPAILAQMDNDHKPIDLAEPGTDSVPRCAQPVCSAALTTHGAALISSPGPLDAHASGTAGASRRDPRADAWPPALRDKLPTSGTNHQG